MRNKSARDGMLSEETLIKVKLTHRIEEKIQERGLYSNN